MIDAVDTPPAQLAPAAADPPTLEQLLAENASLKAKLAEMDAKKTQLSADEIIIAEKVRRGLTRRQAESVLRRQREYDASPEGKAKAARFNKSKGTL